MGKKLNLGAFCSVKNENEGVWFEPKVRGFGTGFEILLYGPNSDVAVTAREEFAKQLEAARDVEDVIEKKNIIERATAEFMAKVTGDIRSKDPEVELENEDGTPVTKKDILNFYLEAPIIVDEISTFFKGRESFLSKKKNA